MKSFIALLIITSICAQSFQPCPSSSGIFCNGCQCCPDGTLCPGAKNCAPSLCPKQQNTDVTPKPVDPVIISSNLPVECPLNKNKFCSGCQCCPDGSLCPNAPLAPQCSDTACPKPRTNNISPNNTVPVQPVNPKPTEPSLPSTPPSNDPLDGNYHNIIIHNKCDKNIWPGIFGVVPKPGGSDPFVPMNGGWLLPAGQTSTVKIVKNWSGRIWPRTGCVTSGGRTWCETGDCGGAFECKGATGIPPASLAEITFDGAGTLDFYDISLVDGYNIAIAMYPLENSITKVKCSGEYCCAEAGCDSDLNAICPKELRKLNSGGTVVACKSACEAFATDTYCCAGAHDRPETCKSTDWPVNYPAIFKKACPKAYSYAYDDHTSTYTCASAPNKLSNYVVEFC